MEDIDDGEKENCYRSNVTFLSTAYIQVKYKQRNKVGEGRNDRNKIFISSVKPLHLKRDLRITSMQYTNKGGPLTNFPGTEISRVASTILKQRLKDETYDQNKCRTLSKGLSNIIQEEIKKLHIPRYKFVCYIHIGQIKGHDMIIASRCLWDANLDNFAQAHYKNNSLFATVSVFGLYCE